MKVMGKLMDHVRLVSCMAKATRTDLVAAHGAGDLTQADWARMVQSCRECTWSDACPTWLEQNDSVTEAPRQCPNRARFQALRAKARQHETEEA